MMAFHYCRAVSDRPLLSLIISNKCDHVTPVFTFPTSGNIGDTENGLPFVPAVLLVKMLKCSVTLYTGTVKRGAVILTNHLFLV